MLSPIRITIGRRPAPLLFVAIYSTVMGVLGTIQHVIITPEFISQFLDSDSIAQKLLISSLIVILFGISLTLLSAGLFTFKNQMKCIIFYKVNLFFNFLALLSIPLLSSISEAKTEVITYVLSIATVGIILMYIRQISKE